MAKKITRTAPATKAGAGKKPAAKNAASRTAASSNVRKVMLAGVGAVGRVQDEAVKVYGLLAAEAQRLSDMTSEAAATLAKKTGIYAREGKKIQSHAAAVVQSRAAQTTKEVKAFATKSEKSLKQNIERTVNNAVAGAKQGVTQLEHVFEARVAKTLNSFGIPSAQDVRELQARMAELRNALSRLKNRNERI